jgi:hypothetical protein
VPADSSQAISGGHQDAGTPIRELRIGPGVVRWRWLHRVKKDLVTMSISGLLVRLTSEGTILTRRRRMQKPNRQLLAQFAAAVIGAAWAAVNAQSFSARAVSTAATVEVARTTSGYRVVAGERATYDVELKGRGVGTASLEVLAGEPTDGQSIVHASLKLAAGLLFAKVDEQFDSWFDPRRFVSHRFVQNQRELRHTRQRQYEIAPENGTFREMFSGDVDTLSTTEPLDDVSFLFYVRTLRLQVGDVDTIPRYFKRGHDVIIRVLRRDSVTVPAGTFRTIVVQPTITNAGGLFGQGGQAEVYLTDDAARSLVMLRSRVPVLGSLALTLRELRVPE